MLANGLPAVQPVVSPSNGKVPEDDVLLEVKDLKVYFTMREGVTRAVDGISYTLHRGETLGIVGESGCGKSVTAQSILRIVPSPGRIVGGQILYHRRRTDSAGQVTTDIIDLVKLDPEGSEIRHIRGDEIAYIFQEPSATLSPVHTIGHQIIETIQLHQHVDKALARKRAIGVLDRVGMVQPSQTIDRYPHQMSGGQRQRAVIAIALSCRPSLLIADEPTTALDVTTEAQILDLIQELQREYGMAVQFITHNLGVVAEMADNVVVMYLGRQIEQAMVDDLYFNARHPYTQALLRAIPKLGKKSGERLESIRGMVPDPYSIPKGCPYHPRCPRYLPGICDDPQWIEVSAQHFARCSRALETVTHA
ncbi:MAG TPA: ABC transporter ATP-binding protein [Chloroflexota bacterium]